MVSVLQDAARTAVPQQQWNTGTWQQFQDIIAHLNKLDAALNQPDCHDPAKAAWMREVETRLAKLESGDAA